MTKELTICTLNVRGFRNKLKRKATYKYIREHNIDVACFQETYITSEIVADIEREWKGTVLSRTGTQKSNGLVTLVSPNIRPENTELIASSDRILVAKVKGHTSDYVIANCYAPCATPEKTQFLELLKRTLQTNENINTIVAGDFNTTMDNSLDNITGLPHADKEMLCFRETVASLDLHDI